LLSLLLEANGSAMLHDPYKARKDMAHLLAITKTKILEERLDKTPQRAWALIIIGSSQQ
jgi:hypothetical protein